MCCTASFPRSRRPDSTLALYLLFFMPGIRRSGLVRNRIRRDSWGSQSSRRPRPASIPIYPLKMVIPIAGGLLLLQGVAEISRCVICLERGEWPQRLHDVEEIDVEELQGGSLTPGHGEAESMKAARFGLVFLALAHRAILLLLLVPEHITRGHLGLLMLGPDRGGDPARLSHRLHADGAGHGVRLHRLPPSRASRSSPTRFSTRWCCAPSA